MQVKVSWTLHTFIDVDEYEDAPEAAMTLDPVRDGDWDGKFTLEKPNVTKPNE